VKLTKYIMGLGLIMTSAIVPITSSKAAEFTAKTVVLVHGAFADGSSWQKVIPYLEKAGLKVVAVQNPLDSLANDVAATQRAIDIADGPVVLVGHSWAGAVITEAGNSAKVKSLVYVAAYAPDSGQSVGDITSKYPAPESLKYFVKDAGGYVKISDEGIKKFFAADLDSADEKLVAAVQGPLHISTLSTKISHAAWRDKPSFMVVATKDQIIPPQLEKDQVKLANAKSVEVPSGHLALLSFPKQVADLIIKAAE
jgi:pimeloyl-ACP methyl ester carboxylesterase